MLFILFIESIRKIQHGAKRCNQYQEPQDSLPHHSGKDPAETMHGKFLSISVPKSVDRIIRTGGKSSVFRDL